MIRIREAIGAGTLADFAAELRLTYAK
jgi:hypothetical protein